MSTALSSTVFAVATPGLEAALAAELAALGVSGDVVPGGVELAAIDDATLVRLNRQSRIASKLLVRIGAPIEAENFAQLRRRAAAIDWSSYLTKSTELTFAIETHRCRLYHTGGIEENLRLAVGDAKLAKGASQPSQQRLVVRGHHNRFTISIDASGELLHKRGYRTHIGEAPLRETLASGVLRLAGYDPTLPLLDPMCGSGSFLLEAAAIATGTWPNPERALACLDWPRLRALAPPALPVPHPAAASIIGRDRDARVLEAASANLERTPFASAIRFEAGDLPSLRAPAERGLVICNPPYGKRLGATTDAKRTAQQLGRTLKERFAGWRAAILLPPAIAQSLGLRAEQQHALSNGGLRVVLTVTTITRN